MIRAELQDVMLNNNFQDIVSEATGATKIYKISVIQILWSGYGDIVRYVLKKIIHIFDYNTN